jgi:hypothetical protein
MVKSLETIGAKLASYHAGVVGIFRADIFDRFSNTYMEIAQQHKHAFTTAPNTNSSDEPKEALFDSCFNTPEDRDGFVKAMCEIVGQIPSDHGSIGVVSGNAPVSNAVYSWAKAMARNGYHF